MSQGCRAQVEQGPASTRALEARPESRPQVTPGAMLPEMLTLTGFTKGQMASLRPQGGKYLGWLLTRHRHPVARRTLGARGVGPAGESGADLRDHAAKGIIVLDGPVSLKKAR